MMWDGVNIDTQTNATLHSATICLNYSRFKSQEEANNENGVKVEA